MSPSTRLKRVAWLRAGGTPAVDDPANWSDDAADGMPWVSISDMSDGSEVTSTGRCVTDAGLSSKRLPVGEPGTLLFAMYASVGAVAELGTRATWNQALLGITPRDGLSHPRFIRYWLEHLRTDLSALVRSNTQDNLNAEQAGNFPFPTLPASAQRAIADYLDTETARIDALIAKKQRMIDLLDERRWALLDRLTEASSETPVTSLKRVALFFTDGDWIESLYITDSGIRLIQTGNIGRGDFRDQGDRYISEGTFKELGCKEVMPGDVLISRLANTVGQACLAPDLGCRMVTSVDVVILRPAPIVSRDFLVRFMSTNRYLSLARLEARGTTMQRLARSQVGDLPIPLPPLAEQVRLVDEVEAATPRLAAAIQKLNAQIDLLREHRQALITAAVTGELEVPGVAA